MSVNSPSGGWQRHYVSRGSAGGAIVFVIIGTAFLLIGSVFAVGGFVMWHNPGAPIFAIVGSLFAVMGLAFPFFAWNSYRHGKDLDILCHADGFTVTTTSRSQGSQVEKYAWSEVTATEYTEETFDTSSSSQTGSSTRTVGYFTVQTFRGTAFTVTDSMGKLPELIHVFNQSTPQLPYVWTAQVGFNISLGSLGRRLAFQQSPRDVQPDVVTAALASAAPTMATPMATSMAEPSPLPASGNNGFGLLGFILSMFGLLCTFGLISPIGLLLSIVGLFRPNKGLAIAGTVVGCLGTILSVSFMSYVLHGLFVVGELSDTIKTEVTMNDAVKTIVAHRFALGRLPDDDEAQDLLGDQRDAFGTLLRYHRESDDKFELRSAGPDKQFNTADDITRTDNGLPPEKESEKQPAQSNKSCP